MWPFLQLESADPSWGCDPLPSHPIIISYVHSEKGVDNEAPLNLLIFQTLDFTADESVSKAKVQQNTCYMSSHHGNTACVREPAPVSWFLPALS